LQYQGGKWGIWVDLTLSKTGLGHEVKPFGNSQKGIGKARLTWLAAWDKYARH
jgi:hypothetical protein